MRNIVAGVLALSALIGASGSAYALSESGVSQADIAQVASAVASIPDQTVRAQASGLVTEASGLVNEGEHQRAYQALNRALVLAQANQVAEAAQ